MFTYNYTVVNLFEVRYLRLYHLYLHDKASTRSTYSIFLSEKLLWLKNKFYLG